MEAEAVSRLYLCLIGSNQQIRWHKRQDIVCKQSIQFSNILFHFSELTRWETMLKIPPA